MLSNIDDPLEGISKNEYGVRRLLGALGGSGLAYGRMIYRYMLQHSPTKVRLTRSAEADIAPTLSRPESNDFFFKTQPGTIVP